MTNDKQPTSSQSDDELEELLLRTAYWGHHWFDGAPNGLVDISKDDALAKLSQLNQEAYERGMLAGRISELNRLDHEPQMWGDWQQVIADRLQQLTTEQGAADKGEGAKSE